MTMPAWGDAQIRRFNFRHGLFIRRGIEPMHAERLADQLATRDYEHDDRRMCLECVSYQRSRTCFKRLPMSIEQLARCHGFEWQKP